MILNFEDETRFIFPTPEDIEESFEKALSDSSEDYRFKANLDSIYKWIEVAELFEATPDEKIEETLEDTDISFPALGASESFCRWQEDNSYYDIKAGLYLLSEAYEISRDRDWRTVAIFCLKKLIEIEKELSYDYSDEIERTIRFLEDGHQSEDQLSLGKLGDLTYILIDNGDSISIETALRALVVSIERANALGSEGSHFQERDVLKAAIELGNYGHAAVHGLERRYVETYRHSSEKEENYLSQGTIIRDALGDEIVLRTLSEKEKNCMEKPHE